MSVYIRKLRNIRETITLIFYKTNNSIPQNDTKKLANKTGKILRKVDKWFDTK